MRHTRSLGLFDLALGALALFLLALVIFFVWRATQPPWDPRPLPERLHPTEGTYPR